MLNMIHRLDVILICHVEIMCHFCIYLINNIYYLKNIQKLHRTYIDGRFDFGSSGYNAVGHAVMPLHAALSA